MYMLVCHAVIAASISGQVADSTYLDACFRGCKLDGVCPLSLSQSDTNPGQNSAHYVFNGMHERGAKSHACC